MTHHELRFAITRQQQALQNTLLMSLLVSLVGIISAALGPQVVYQYFLQTADPNLQMAVLQYFPAVAYGAVVLSFVWAVISAFTTSRRVRMYDQELQLLSYTDMCCGPCDSACDCECHPSDAVKSATHEAQNDAQADLATSSKKSVSSTASSKKKTAAKRTTTKK